MVKPATIDVLQTDHTTVVVVRLNEAVPFSARQLVKLRLVVSAKAPCHSSERSALARHAMTAGVSVVKPWQMFSNQYLTY